MFRAADRRRNAVCPRARTAETPFEGADERPRGASGSPSIGGLGGEPILAGGIKVGAGDARNGVAVDHGLVDIDAEARPFRHGEATSTSTGGWGEMSPPK